MKSRKKLKNCSRQVIELECVVAHLRTQLEISQGELKTLLWMLKVKSVGGAKEQVVRLLKVEENRNNLLYYNNPSYIRRERDLAVSRANDAISQMNIIRENSVKILDLLAKFSDPTLQGAMREIDRLIEVEKQHDSLLNDLKLSQRDAAS